MQRVILSFFLIALLTGHCFGQATSLGEGAPANAEKLLSIDIPPSRPVTVQAALRQIATLYGCDIVFDKSVFDSPAAKIPIDIAVNNKPWWQVFVRICKANGLAYRYDEGVITVLTVQAYEEGEKALFALRQAQRRNLPKVTEVIPLQWIRLSQSGITGNAGILSTGVSPGGLNVSLLGYQSPNNNQTSTPTTTTSATGNNLVVELVQQTVTSEGRVTADARTNSLIVTGVQEDIDSAKKLVLLLDRPLPQIEFEVAIVEANDAFEKSLGVELQGLVFNSGTGAAGGFSTTSTTNTGLPGTTTPPGIGGGLLGGTPTGNQLRANNPNSVLSLTTGAAGTYRIAGALTAAQSKGWTKQVAYNRVTVSNYVEAVLTSQQQVPFVTSQVGQGFAAPTAVLIPVGIQIKILPQLSADGNAVLMKIEVTSGSVGAATVGTFPILNTASSTTQVQVENFGTTILSGMTQEIQTRNQNGTPFLSSVPVIGNFFKQNRVTNNQRKMLVFITARYLGKQEAVPVTSVNPPAERK